MDQIVQIDKQIFQIKSKLKACEQKKLYLSPQEIQDLLKAYSQLLIRKLELDKQAVLDINIRPKSEFQETYDSIVSQQDLTQNQNESTVETSFNQMTQDQKTEIYKRYLITATEIGRRDSEDDEFLFQAGFTISNKANTHEFFDSGLIYKNFQEALTAGKAYIDQNLMTID